jgi:hypothetical protein
MQPCPISWPPAHPYRPRVLLLTNARALAYTDACGPPAILSKPRDDQPRPTETMLRVRDELLLRIVDGDLATDLFSHKTDHRGTRVVMVELARMLGLDPTYVRSLVASARRVRCQLKAGTDAA